MNLQHLETFRIVAQELSFIRASQILNFAQSSISAHIQSLENELGVRLFDRRGKHVSLTDAGTRLLTYAQKILNLTHVAKAQVVGEHKSTGTLKVGIFESLSNYRLLPVIKRFNRMYPNVELKLISIDVNNINQALNQDVDISLIIEMSVQFESLIVKPLVGENIILLAHPEHRLTNREYLQKTELINETLLLTEPGCKYRQLFERSLHMDGGVTLRKMEFNSVEAIKKSVIHNLGIAVLPEMSVLQEINVGRLVRLNWEITNEQMFSQLIWHKDKWISPVIQSFIDITYEEFQKQVQ